MTPVSTRPACLDRAGVAAYLSLSESTIEKLTREGGFPRPRLLSSKRCGWLVSELDEWLAQRPVSDLAPPPNTGAPKPGRRGRRPAPLSDQPSA